MPLLLPAFQRVPIAAAAAGEWTTLPAELRFLLLDEMLLESNDVTTVTAPAPTRRELAGIASGESLVVYAIDPGAASFTIGRKAAADVVIPDRRVSSKHARLERTAEGNYWLTDLKSSNGSFVESRDVGTSRVLLTPGTVFVLGRLPLQLVDVALLSRSILMEKRP